MDNLLLIASEEDELLPRYVAFEQDQVLPINLGIRWLKCQDRTTDGEISIGSKIPFDLESGLMSVGVFSAAIAVTTWSKSSNGQKST